MINLRKENVQSRPVIQQSPDSNPPPFPVRIIYSIKMTKVLIWSSKALQNSDSPNINQLVIVSSNKNDSDSDNKW